MEDNEAGFRLLEEESHRLQVEEEKRFQLEEQTYEIARKADQLNIKQKKQEIKQKEQEIQKKEQEIKETELALNNLKADLQTAIQTADQRQDDRKRKHEAKVQSLDQAIENLKRLKRSTVEPWAEMTQPSVPSILALHSGQPNLGMPTSRPRLHSTPEALAGGSRMSAPAYISKEDSATHASPSVQSLLNSSFHESTVISRSGSLNNIEQQDSALSSGQDSAAPKPIEDQPGKARAEATEDDDVIGPHLDNCSVSDDLYDSTEVEEPSDGESTLGNGKLTRNGESSSSQAQSRPLALTKKTIAFDEVFELNRDPHSEYKHGIFEYPRNCGNWYIVRCVEHSLNWGIIPIRGAAMHLQSHGFPTKSKLAIKKLGELVEGCDRQKADLSNAQYQKAINQGYTPKKHMTRSRQEVQAAPAQDSGHGPSESIIDPVVGQIYQAWWEPYESWFSVVVLPYLGDGNWKEVGMTGNLFSSALKDDIPKTKCFKKTKTTTDSGEEVSKLTWAEGYQDDGRKVNSRQFPCLFLHPPLRIPSANQEFTLDRKTEKQVLAFRTVEQLRHPPTDLPEELDTMGVIAFRDITQKFKARLKAIKSRQNSAPEQEFEDNVNGPSSLLQDQQRPNPKTSVETIESPQLSPASSAPQHNSTGSELPISGDGSSDNRDQNTLAAQSAKVSPALPLQSHQIGRHSPLHLSQLGNNLMSDREIHPLTMGGHGSIQGMADLSNGSRANLSNISRSFPGPRGRIEESGRTSQPLKYSKQGMSGSSSDSQGLRAAEAANFSSPKATRLASKPRGPTALRPLDWKGNARHSEEVLQRDEVSHDRRSVDMVERNAVPNDAGETTGPSSYSATLRQAWRHSENQ